MKNGFLAFYLIFTKMKKTEFNFLVMTSIFILLAGCNDESLKLNQNRILGTWISTNNLDTLHFLDDSNFFKSSSTMHYDHFDYQLFTDSIKVGYSGVLYISVKPTMHKYSLTEGSLMIDFENQQCYGFDLIKMTYDKID